MSYMANAMIEMAEAGAIMADPAEVVSWRREGHDVPLRYVEIDTYRGRRPMPAIGLATAERLSHALADEAARETLRQAVADATEYLDMIGGPCRCDDCGCRGRWHFFVTSMDGETLCINCA